MEAALCLATIVLPALLVGMAIGAKMKASAPPETPAEPVPTTETRSRFPNDIALRKAGFAIAARPDRGQASWVRNGLVYLESDAVRRMRGMDAARGAE